MLPGGAPAGTNRDYLTTDPTKLLIGTTGLRRSGEDVRQRLFHDYGIYLSRTLPDAFLVNFHIGIAAEDVDRLLQSLRSLAHRLGAPAAREQISVPRTTAPPSIGS